MNTAKTDEIETTQTSFYDPFPEPQTVPKGWDVSNLTPRRKQSFVAEVASEMERKYRYPGIMYD